MKSFIVMYKSFFADKKAVWLAVVAIILFAAGVFINFYAGRYANISQSNSVTDIILSNIRAFDVDMLFVYATFVWLLTIVIYIFSKPFQFPFLVKAISLFIIIRCGFIVLTHIAAFPTVITMDKTITFYNFFNHFSFTGDLFFSGHTWLPFLLALIFWKNKILRYITLGISIFFAVIVLLGHYHYSIDVLSAFFISYGIYHISILLFPRDKKYFDESFAPMPIK